MKRRCREDREASLQRVQLKVGLNGCSRVFALRKAAKRRPEGSQTWNVWKADRQGPSALETRKARKHQAGKRKAIK
jgi:hypothetical protein